MRLNQINYYKKLKSFFIDEIILLSIKCLTRPFMFQCSHVTWKLVSLKKTWHYSLLEHALQKPAVKIVEGFQSFTLAMKIFSSCSSLIKMRIMLCKLCWTKGIKHNFLSPTIDCGQRLSTLVIFWTFNTNDGWWNFESFRGKSVKTIFMVKKDTIVTKNNKKLATEIKSTL